MSKTENEKQPMTDETKTDETKTEETKTEETKTDTPKVDTEKADEPKAEDKKAEDKNTEAKKADEPKADDKKADADKQADTEKADEAAAVVTPTPKKRWPWVVGAVAAAAVAVIAIILLSTQGWTKDGSGDAMAVVNGEKIPMSAYTEQTTMYDESQKAYAEEEREARTNEINQLIVNQLVEQKLIEQMAKEAGVEVSSEDIDTEYDSIMSMYGGSEDAEALLAEQGISVESFKNQVRIQLYVEGFVEKELSNLPVTDEDARAYYDTHPAEFAGEDGQPLPFDQVAEAAKEASVSFQQNEEFGQRLEAFLKSAKIEVFIEGLKAPTTVFPEEAQGETE